MALLGECAFNAPVVLIQTRPKCSDANTVATCPFSQRQPFSVEFKPASGPFVIRLLDASGPSAILWAVWSVVVDAVERTSVWAMAHVGQKVLEGISPSVAHVNTASAIEFEHARLWIVTTSSRILPDGIFIRLREAMRAIRRAAFDATAMLHLPETQLFRAENQCIPAVALTYPPPRLVPEFLSDAFNDHEVSEPVSTVEVSSFRHKG